MPLSTLTEKRPHAITDEPPGDASADPESARLEALRSIRDLRQLRARAALAQAQREVEEAQARIVGAEDRLARTTRSVHDRRLQLQSDLLARPVRREGIESARQTYCKLDREIALDRDALMTVRQQHLEYQAEVENCSRSFRQATKAKEKLDQGLRCLREGRETK